MSDHVCTSVPRMSLQVRDSAGSPQAGLHGCFINGRHYGGLSMVLLQLKNPLELFMNRREVLHASGFQSCRNMT